MNSAPYFGGALGAVIDIDRRDQHHAEARRHRRLLDLLRAAFLVAPRLRIAASEVRQPPLGVEARVADLRLVRQERPRERRMRPRRRQPHPSSSVPPGWKFISCVPLRSIFTSNGISVRPEAVAPRTDERAVLDRAGESSRRMRLAAAHAGRIDAPATVAGARPFQVTLTP